jgi:hypothetical protein
VRKAPSRETLRAVQKLEMKHTREIRAMENAARGLERETQTYKDERANDLRSQIERERGSYATKEELAAVLHSTEDRFLTGANNGWTRALAVSSIAVSVALGLYLGLH